MAKRGAPKGNKNKIALKDPDVRQRAYESFCANISSGYPLKAWSFREGEFKCGWQTMLSYIERAVEFDLDPFLKEEAHATSYRLWFDKGVALTDGHIKGNPSPTTWAVIMRNMFAKDGWDKENQDSNVHSKLERMVDGFRREFKQETEASNSHVGQKD